MTKLEIVEVVSYANIPLVWYLFKRFAGKNIWGELLMGTLFGCFIEFVTDSVEVYNFKWTLYNDVPPCIPIDWALMFVIAAFFSEKLYQRWRGHSFELGKDWRILLTDVFCGALVGVPCETLGHHLGVWEYSYEHLNWSGIKIPFFHMPIEVLIGYSLAMLVGPTFLRAWRPLFQKAAA